MRPPLPGARRGRRRRRRTSSTSRAQRPLEEIAAARARGHDRPRRGLRRTTCCFERAPHEGPDGLRYVMTPPLRTADDRTALMRGLRDGALDTYAVRSLPPAARPGQAAGRRRLHEGSDRVPGIGARLPAGVRARGRRRGAALAGAPRRGRLRRAGAHLRPLSAEGRDRAGQRCRHRRLGPVAPGAAHARGTRRRARLVALRRDRRARDDPRRLRARRPGGRRRRLRGEGHRGAYLPVDRVRQ